VWSGDARSCRAGRAVLSRPAAASSRLSVAASSWSETPDRDAPLCCPLIFSTGNADYVDRLLRDERFPEARSNPASSRDKTRAPLVVSLLRLCRAAMGDGVADAAHAREGWRQTTFHVEGRALERRRQPFNKLYCCVTALCGRPPRGERRPDQWPAALHVRARAAARVRGSRSVEIDL